MTLRLYNTLTRRKDDLESLPGFDPANVRMYVCGPTVYDFAHIGNARPVIVFDVLYRLLRHLYGEGHVTYVRNITDIDDKINARAAETAAAKNIPVEQARAEITAATAQQFKDDVAALGCLEPDATPRATEYVPQMIAMIGRLIAEGHAYEAEGHVLFDVSSKSDYGKLSRRSLDEMMAGARVDVAPYKKNPMDFVLWKPSDDQTPGWPSPWGRGRPGWHIECSAMGEALLGETFDIHGGGIDLMFPHHENEIAQSEACHHGHPLARLWMHNGFLQVEGEKMSKSLGNFVTINELLRTDKFGGRPWHGGVLRLAMLKTHYKKPIDWTLDQLKQCRLEMEKFTYAASSWNATITIAGAEKHSGRIEPDKKVIDALENDLDTSLAISHLHELAAEAPESSAKAQSFLANLEFLGLMDRQTADHYSTIGPATDIAVGQILYKHDELDVAERIRVALANNDAAALSKWRDMVAEWGVNVGQDEFGKLEFRAVATKDVVELQRSAEAAIAARTAARKAKNFSESDRIRDELLAQGIILKDGPAGTTWEVKR